MVASIFVTEKTEATWSKEKILISCHHFLLSPLTRPPFELHVKKRNPLSYCTEPRSSLGAKVGQATASLLAGAGGLLRAERPAHPSLSARPIHNSRSPTGNSFAPETRRLGAGVGRACVGLSEEEEASCHGPERLINKYALVSSSCEHRFAKRIPAQFLSVVCFFLTCQCWICMFLDVLQPWGGGGWRTVWNRLLCGWCWMGNSKGNMWLGWKVKLPDFRVTQSRRS